MVKLLINAEVRALNLRADPARITDLWTNRQYSIFWGGPPVGEGHTDFSPLTPQDTEIMRQISNGWDLNWRPRPVILHIENQTGHRHDLAVAVHHFPHGNIIGGNPGLPNMSNSPPPRGQNWPIGGHFCMYYMDSTGGTQGMREMAHEAFRISLSRGAVAEQGEQGEEGENSMNIIQRPSPNHTRGRQGHVPDLIVCHITDGAFPGSIDWVINPTSQVSYHFMISRVGEITQCVDIENMAWANGTNNNTNQNARLAVVHERNVNANLYSISIGFEGRHSETRGALTTEQQASAVWLMQHIRKEIQRIWRTSASIPLTREHIVGHIDITPITRPNCPGERFPFDEIINTLIRSDTSTPNQPPQQTTTPPTTSTHSTALQQMTAPATTVPPTTVPPTSITPPQSTNTIFRVRVGAFDNRAEADAVRDRLRASGHGDAWTVQNGDKGFWQAQAASGPNLDGAERLAEVLRVQGFDDVVVI